MGEIWELRVLYGLCCVVLVGLATPLVWHGIYSSAKKHISIIRVISIGCCCWLVNSFFFWHEDGGGFLFPWTGIREKENCTENGLERVQGNICTVYSTATEQIE